MILWGCELNVCGGVGMIGVRGVIFKVIFGFLFIFKMVLFALPRPSFLQIGLATIQGQMWRTRFLGFFMISRVTFLLHHKIKMTN